MIRPNYAQDEPPVELSIGGNSYPIQTDYRIWIEALDLMRDISFVKDDEERNQKSIGKLAQLEELVFGDVIEEDVEEVINALSKFANGYPMAPIRQHESPYVGFSYKYDIDAIIIAIRNQSGIDLSYRCKYYHWWLFLLEFRTLCGEHYILNLIGARTYEGQDKDLVKRRNDCTLPYEYSEDEIEEYRQMEELFEKGEAT